MKPAKSLTLATTALKPILTSHHDKVLPPNAKAYCFACPNRWFVKTTSD